MRGTSVAESIVISETGIPSIFTATRTRFDATANLTHAVAWGVAIVMDSKRRENDRHHYGQIDVFPSLLDTDDTYLL